VIEIEHMTPICMAYTQLYVTNNIQFGIKCKRKQLHVFVILMHTGSFMPTFYLAYLGTYIEVI